MLAYVENAKCGGKLTLYIITENASFHSKTWRWQHHFTGFIVFTNNSNTWSWWKEGLSETQRKPWNRNYDGMVYIEELYELAQLKSRPLSNQCCLWQDLKIDVKCHLVKWCEMWPLKIRITNIWVSRLVKLCNTWLRNSSTKYWLRIAKYKWRRHFSDLDLWKMRKPFVTLFYSTCYFELVCQIKFQ